MRIPVYASPHTPATVAEKGCEKLGMLNVNLLESGIVAGSDLKVKMKFEGGEIKVTAMDIKSGAQASAQMVFPETYALAD